MENPNENNNGCNGMAFATIVAFCGAIIGGAVYKENRMLGVILGTTITPLITYSLIGLIGRMSHKNSSD